MSVIVALASTRDGVVASDGRFFDSVQVGNSQIVQASLVESDSFDKTFSIADGKIIGAFCGLMKFSGRTVAEHVLEIVDGTWKQASDLATVVDQIDECMKTRLQEVQEQDVSFPRRNLDILLVAGENLTRAKFRIVSLRFFPHGNNISSTKESVAISQDSRFYVRGDRRASESLVGFMRHNRVARHDVVFLEELAVSAVKAGTQDAGTHIYSSDIVCGGKVFTKRTFY